MRRIIILASLLFWACEWSPTRSEPEPGTWELVRESTGEHPYQAIHFADNSHGWAVGDSGRIIHSGDGGLTWTRQTSGTFSSLGSVHFISSQEGWVAGGDNTLLHTADGGQTWHSRAPSGDSSRIFTELTFYDEMTGWVAHNQGELLFTDDGGMTWSVQLSWAAGGPARISFVDDQVGYVLPLTDSLLYRTVNGGLDWVPVSLQRFRWVRDLFFTDEQVGWIPTSSAPS